MRSTTRQRHGETVRAGAATQDWNGRLALGLRVVLAASTVVATLALLTQDTARTEMRWLLAFLATSLFLVSMIETTSPGGLSAATLAGRRQRDVEPGLGEEPRTAAGERPAVGVESLSTESAQVDDEVNIRQLASHRTDYVSTVSHELRTPLTSIRGFAQLITRGELAPSVTQSYAGTIVNEADRLARIIDDIVALTKMESALLSLRAEPFSILDVVTRLLKRLQSGREPLRLALEVEGTLPAVRGDEEELYFALEKLVLSALDSSTPETLVRLLATSEGSIVTIRATFATSPAQMARVKEGIEDLWRCGDDGLATRLGRGSIDLYVAKNLIEAHGGSVGVEGTGGDQACISVSLPASQDS